MAPPERRAVVTLDSGDSGSDCEECAPPAAADASLLARARQLRAAFDAARDDAWRLNRRLARLAAAASPAAAAHIRACAAPCALEARLRRAPAASPVAATLVAFLRGAAPAARAAPALRRNGLQFLRLNNLNNSLVESDARELERLLFGFAQRLRRANFRLDRLSAA